MILFLISLLFFLFIHLLIYFILCFIPTFIPVSRSCYIFFYNSFFLPPRPCPIPALSALSLFSVLSGCLSPLMPGPASAWPSQFLLRCSVLRCLMYSDSVSCCSNSSPSSNLVFLSPPLLPHRTFILHISSMSVLFFSIPSPALFSSSPVLTPL